eukprot:scaffold12194_cov23-Tisochrysis_lutea.AAC.1
MTQHGGVCTRSAKPFTHAPKVLEAAHLPPSPLGGACPTSPRTPTAGLCLWTQLALYPCAGLPGRDQAESRPARINPPTLLYQILLHLLPSLCVCQWSLCSADSGPHSARVRPLSAAAPRPRPISADLPVPRALRIATRRSGRLQQVLP